MKTYKGGKGAVVCVCGGGRVGRGVSLRIGLRKSEEVEE